MVSFVKPILLQIILKSSVVGKMWGNKKGNHLLYRQLPSYIVTSQGFEPQISSAVTRCSIQLCYEAILMGAKVEILNQYRLKKISLFFMISVLLPNKPHNIKMNNSKKYWKLINSMLKSVFKPIVIRNIQMRHKYRYSYQIICCAE